ncbi:MAG: triose-phosphate isomerase [Prevotellaceae bacterium]|jgi:triosephosphate isomerase|nr:triose-phosphate isomerase [Prevotellaceae bacterium]
MRNKIVAGNWKMNTTYDEGENLIKGIIEKKSTVKSDVTLIVAPPFTHLCCFAEPLQKAGVGISAQNCANHEKGAYTGEISAAMLASIDVQYCIIGHSERREYYGETNDILLEKVKLALKYNLTPIFCIGEKLSEREAGKQFEVVKTQLQTVVSQLSAVDFAKIIIAYEPVWAIGTGKTATSAQAQEVHAYIRTVLKETFGAAADNTSILYGGSCNPATAPELFSQPDIDGGLIGGASLKADDFIAVASAF